MKTGGGDFSAEAYEQLREAYDKEQQRQVDDEVRGTQLMGQEYGLETAPVDSPWADKIDLWTYPDGKQPRQDEKQSPDEILQIMRDAAQERIDAAKDDEEEPEVEGEETETEEEEVEVDEDEEEETEEEDEDEDEDEEDEESEDDTEDEEDEDEDEESEPEVEEVESVDEEYDPEELAAQIAELRSEIESMQFVSEEPEADDE